MAELTSSLASNINEEIDLPSTITLATLDIGPLGGGGGFYVLQSVGSINLSSGLNKSSGGRDVIDVPINLSAPTNFTVASGLSLTVDEAVSGHGLTKSGAGVLMLTSHANSYSGGTTISNGTLELAGEGTLPSGAVTDNGSLVFSPAGDLVVGNSIGGTGTVTVNENTVTLSGNNTYSGGTTINFGDTLQVATGSSLGSGPVTDDSSLVFNRTDTSTVANSIAGSGDVTVEGGGTVALSANTYSGRTTVISSTLSVSSDANLGADPTNAIPSSIVLDDDATLQATASFVLDSNRGVELDYDYSGSITSDNISVTTGNLLIYGGVIDSDGVIGLVVTGGGTFEPEGSNTYSGGTTVTGGAVLEVSKNANLGPVTGGEIVLNGGAVEPLPGFTADANQIIMLGPSSGSGSGTILVPLGETFFLGDSVLNNGSGTGGLILTGGGTLDFDGGGQYSGGTTISQGILQIGYYSVLGSGPVTLNDANTGTNNTALLATFGGTTAIPNNITVANQGTGTSTLGTTAFGGSSPTVFAGNVTLDEAVTFQGGNSGATDGTV